MYKGYSETNTLKVGEFTRGEPSRGRGTRLTVRLGMKKRAYMGKGHSVGRIHKNTRGIAKPGQVIEWKITNEHKWIYQICGAGGKNSCGNRNASIPFCWKELPPSVWSDSQTGSCSLDVASNPLQMLSTLGANVTFPC